MTMPKAYFQVIAPFGVVTFPNVPRDQEVWARQGQVVEASHPVLQAILQPHLHKCQPLGSTLRHEHRPHLVSVLPPSVQTRIERYDREAAGALEPTREGLASEAKAGASDGSPTPPVAPPVDPPPGADPQGAAPGAPGSAGLAPDAPPAPSGPPAGPDAPQAAPGRARKGGAA